MLDELAAEAQLLLADCAFAAGNFCAPAGFTGENAFAGNVEAAVGEKFAEREFVGLGYRAGHAEPAAADVEQRKIEGFGAAVSMHAGQLAAQRRQARVSIRKNSRRCRRSMLTGRAVARPSADRAAAEIVVATYREITD